jgi:SPP1 family phage portal protein
MATPAFITYKSNDNIEDVMEILKYNDYQTEDADFLLDALIYGIAAELMYIDGAGKTRFRLINPTQCFGIYDDSLSGDLLYFVRWYDANEWDDSNKIKVDVYSDTSVQHYEMAGFNGALSFVGEERHYFAQCPANIFTMPDEKSVFDCIIDLQDDMNEVLSSEIDDYSAFCDAYLVISGMDADNETIAASHENKTFVAPEGSTMSYLTKNTNDTQVENILKRIHDSIYRVAQCPDFSSESFTGGVSSGVAIQYRLTGMETRCGIVEGRMKKALQRRIEIICGIASLTLDEAVFRDITIEFKRNVPEDISAKIQMINALAGRVSDATLLAQLSFVEDVEAELEAVAAQRQANMDLYNFGYHTDEEDEVA